MDRLHAPIRWTGLALSTGLVLAITALLPTSLAARQDSTGEPLVILAEDAAAPWAFGDGTGYANDVVRAAFRAAGVDVRLEVVPYARAKGQTLSGAAAGCFSMAWSPEFAGKIEFSEKPLYVCRADYFHDLRRPIPAHSEVEPRDPITVGTVVGYEYPAGFYPLVERGLLRVDPAPSEVSCLRKLAAGRIDVALINHNEIKTLRYLLSSAGVRAPIALAMRGGELESFIGFSLKHPRGRWARDRYNEGFRIISSDGTLRSIERKWSARMSSGEAPRR